MSRRRRTLSVSQVAQLRGLSKEAVNKQIRRGELKAHRERGRRGNARGNWLIQLDSFSSGERARAVEMYPELAEAPAAHAAPKKRRPRGPDKYPHPDLPDRFPISKDWWQGIDLKEQPRLQVALDTHEKCLELSGGRTSRSGTRKIRQLLGPYVYTRCRELGSKLPDTELRRLSRPERRWVEKWCRRRQRILERARNDRKWLTDTDPDITRERPTHPLDLIVGDITPLDILVRRSDGSQLKIAIIGWHCPATNMFWFHVFPRAKGRSVGQDAVAWSFAVFCSQVAVPKVVMIDGGSEYKAIKRLAEAGLLRVIKTTPGNARAKPIEGIFGTFQRHYVSQIHGSMRGDRMKPLIETAGQRQAEYGGGAAELRADLNRALQMYLRTPQSGLGDRSPLEMLDAALASGWRARRANVATIMEGTAKRVTPIVTRQHVRLGDGARWTSDELCRAVELEGKRVTVYVPVVAGLPPSVYDPAGAFVGFVYPAESFGYTDTAGAKEKGRLKALRRERIRELERAAPPADPAPYEAAFLDQFSGEQDWKHSGDVELPDPEQRRAAEARPTAGLVLLPPPAPTELPDDDPRDLELLKRLNAAGRVR